MSLRALLTSVVSPLKARSTPEFSTLSLHDALPICMLGVFEDPAFDKSRLALFEPVCGKIPVHYETDSPNDPRVRDNIERSEEHTSELQSPCNLVCRLLLEKEKQHAERTLHEKCTRA